MLSILLHDQDPFWLVQRGLESGPGAAVKAKFHILRAGPEQTAADYTPSLSIQNAQISPMYPCTIWPFDYSQT